MHEEFLLAALKEAHKGRGFCAPNPSVGAVAVKDGQIIERAMHKGAGQAHAERVLIEKLGKDKHGLTLYVTLEPCNHFGKTPPCAEHIIKAGFKKVVFGFYDPNPIVAAQNTVKILRESNIEVVHYPLAEIDEFYNSYSYWLDTKKPWVSAKIAQSFDGKIAGEDSTQVLLSNKHAFTFTHEKRLCADVILTTAKTINADNPRLNVRLDNCHAKKHIAIIDSDLNLNKSSRILTTAQHCHIFYNEAHNAPSANSNITYYPMPLRGDGIDIEKVILELGAIGFHDVFVEAGGRLFSSLHAQRLVQRTYIYLVPRVLGSNSISAYPIQEDIFASAKGVKWHPLDDNMLATIDWPT